MIALRDYQREAIDSVYSWFEDKTGNPLVVVPTGGGKSVIMAELVREIIQSWPNERVLVVTHVKELIEQNHRTFHTACPEIKAGVYSAGIGRRDTNTQVLFAGVQSVYKKTDAIGSFDLILIDEAHLIPFSGLGMYRTLLSKMAEKNPKVRLIGFTATPFRTDNGRLDAGEGKLFDGVAYDIPVSRLIEEKWLATVTNQGVVNEIDTDAIHTRMGEFVAQELENAATEGCIVEKSVDEMIQRAGDRKSWIIFCCGVKHAEMVCDQLKAKGISCDSIYGDTGKDKRTDVVERFRNREIKALVNVGVLTTGFDVPHIDLIAMMRPTKSAGLYIQMVGRGMRRAEGKTDCLVLDYGGNIMRHGPIDKVRVKKPGVGEADGDAPMKKCPSCLLIIFAGLNKCPGCGFEFEMSRGTKHLAPRPDHASTLVSGTKDLFERWEVGKVFYARHIKANAPDDHPKTLKVTYDCGFQRVISEWVCFEHHGFARRKAESWWAHRGLVGEAPRNIYDVLHEVTNQPIKEPSVVIVDTRGDYPQIVGFKMDEEEAGWKADAESAKAEPATTQPKQTAEVDYGDIPF